MNIKIKEPSVRAELEKVELDTRAAEKPQADGSTLWEIRTQEQPYAFLADKEIKETNRYGQKIDLVDLTGLPESRSMYINENPEVGCNPNRNKQHGFFFTADNCIGCHACEAACAEKNETPAHLAFRSVGYVEGGSYPDYQRLNISMACNHCDDPVCLKGCPTRAYTKHAEYGAVLQDPETCFGCGYCTWVCPYNAPQLDPVQGQVSKCNMCVDRLEVGLKPACVSACLGNALDFGVIENIPENREQAKVSIPGFPNPEITHPNIRFQQIKKLPEEMTRTDSQPVKYHRDEKGQYNPEVDHKKGIQKFWNFSRLSSRENPLVLFTLLSQAAIGAFVIVFVGSQLGVSALSVFSGQTFYVPLAIVCLGLVAVGLFMSTVHLGKPLRFYRGFNNLRHSPVCREGFSVALFMAFLGWHILCSLPANQWFVGYWQAIVGTAPDELIPIQVLATSAAVLGYLAVSAGVAGLYYMNRCYRIKARPFWNHWQVASSFFGSSLSLGSIVASLLIFPSMIIAGQSLTPALQVLALVMAVGIALEGIGLIVHARDMSSASHEGGASHYVQTTTFGKSYLLRNILLGLCMVSALALVLLNMGELFGSIGWSLVAVLLALSSLIGRALFYVLVIPTTMPGAFFWRNKGFEQHARDIGLADMPQVGVVPSMH